MRPKYFDNSSENAKQIQGSGQKRSKAVDIAGYAFLIVVMLTIAAIKFLRSAGSFSEAVGASSGRRIMLVFLPVLCVVTALVYLLLGRKERKTSNLWTALHYSVAAAGGIVLVGGFILMCLNII